jgi:hypothetical protein
MDIIRPASETDRTDTSYSPVIGTDTILEKGNQLKIETRLHNISAMPIYEKKSTEVCSCRKVKFCDRFIVIFRSCDLTTIQEISNVKMNSSFFGHYHPCH